MNLFKSIDGSTWSSPIRTRQDESAPSGVAEVPAERPGRAAPTHPRTAHRHRHSKSCDLSALSLGSLADLPSSSYRGRATLTTDRNHRNLPKAPLSVQSPVQTPISRDAQFEVKESTPSRRRMSESFRATSAFFDLKLEEKKLKALEHDEPVSPIVLKQKNKHHRRVKSSSVFEAMKSVPLHDSPSPKNPQYPSFKNRRRLSKTHIDTPPARDTDSEESDDENWAPRNLILLDTIEESKSRRAFNCDFVPELSQRPETNGGGGHPGPEQALFKFIINDRLYGNLLSMARRRYCEENVLFLKETYRFGSSTAEPQEMFESFIRIANDYIHPNSLNQVNISDEMRQKILKIDTFEKYMALDDITKHTIFYEAQKEIEKVICQNILPQLLEGDSVVGSSSDGHSISISPQSTASRHHSKLSSGLPNLSNYAFSTKSSNLHSPGSCESEPRRPSTARIRASDLLSTTVKGLSKHISRKHERKASRELQQFDLTKMKENSEKRLLKSGALLFNMDPNDCLEQLVKRNLCKRTPKSMALFLHAASGYISKRRLGEFLAKNTGFNQETLKFYCKEFNFKNASIDQALRIFLKHLRLPGEAQQIDRVMESFAKQYHEHNPEVFKEADSGYVLAFSIMMLNTDLHNEAIPSSKKMTFEQFARNNQGADNGNDFSQDMLRDIYQRVKQAEIKMEDGDQLESDVITFMAPTHSGWLHKRNSGKIKAWKKHWFVLNDCCLYYFKKPQDGGPKCIIPLDYVRVGCDLQNACEFILVSKDGKLVKSMKRHPDGNFTTGSHNKFILKAESEDSRDRWVAAIRAEIAHFVEILEESNPNLLRHSQEFGSSMTPQPYLRGAGSFLDQSFTMNAWSHSPSPHRDSVSSLMSESSPEFKFDKSMPLDVGRILCQGWMAKRGLNNAAWQRRFFVLFDRVENHPFEVLFYFGSKQMAQALLDLGSHTYKGYIIIPRIRQMDIKENDRVLSRPFIELVTSERVWIFSPEDFESWSKCLKDALGRYAQA